MVKKVKKTGKASSRKVKEKTVAKKGIKEGRRIRTKSVLKKTAITRKAKPKVWAKFQVSKALRAKGVKLKGKKPPLKKTKKRTAQFQKADRLLEKGRSRGFITNDEILKEFPIIEDDV